MAYLAYDPLQVTALATAMGAALDELRGMACDDPVAAEANGRVSHACVHLEQLWMPLLDRINRCDPLGQVDAGTVSLDDIAAALTSAMADRFGWQLVALDPASVGGALPAAPPTVDEVRTLADLLQHAELEGAIDTPDERAWLAAQLGMIAADPVLAAVFAGSFDRWGELGNRLGYVRQSALDDSVRPVDDVDRTAVSETDAVLLSVATIWTSVNGAGALVDLTLEMEPYAAAVMIRQLSLDPVALAQLSVDVLHRFDRRDGYWAEDGVDGPKTGDLLFETILRTPGAATAFVVASSGEPELLWWTAEDATLAQRVALTGVDPANIGVADAGVVLHAWTAWFAELQPAEQRNLVHLASPWESRATLGTLAAPWFVEYGSMSDGWALSDDQRRADLAFIIEDGDAHDALFHRMSDDTAALTGLEDRHRSEQTVAAAIGLLLQLDEERKIRNATEAKAEWDASWGLIVNFINYAGKLFPEAASVTMGFSKALTKMKKLLDDNGWLGAPPPPGDVAQQAKVMHHRALITCAAVAVRGAYDTLQDNGSIPRDVPPPPLPNADPPDDEQAYGDAYRAWKATNHIVANSAVDLTLDHQYNLFISPAEEGAAAPIG